MEQLKLGKISWRELSTWFGLKPDSLTKSSVAIRQKKLKILKAYAEYHLDEKGKIIIDEIYEPVYSKAYDIIAQEYKKEWGKIRDIETGKINKIFKELQIDTCARVGLTIWYNNKQVNQQIEKVTAQRYTNKIKIEEYLQASDEVRNAKGGQFELFQVLLMDKLGFIPTKRTQLIDKEQGAF